MGLDEISLFFPFISANCSQLALLQAKGIDDDFKQQF